MSGIRKKWSEASYIELLNDLRRLIQAGHTPKTGPYVPERGGWSEDTWNAAKKLGIDLKPVNQYRVRIGKSLRSVITTLHDQEGVPHEGFAKVSLGGTAEDMIRSLALFYFAFRRFPTPDPSRIGKLGWHISEHRLAETVGVKLASMTKYRYWFGDYDTAQALAMQVVMSGNSPDRHVTAEKSILNTAPRSHNRWCYIDLLRKHPKWALNRAMSRESKLEDELLPFPETASKVIPMRTAPPTTPLQPISEEKPVPTPIPVAVPPSRPVVLPPAPPKPVSPSNMNFTITPKFLPGAIVIVRAPAAGVLHIGQVVEISVAITRTGNKFIYKVIQRNAVESSFDEDQLLGPEQLLDALAQLTDYADKASTYVDTWGPESIQNPLL